MFLKCLRSEVGFASFVAVDSKYPLCATNRVRSGDSMRVVNLQAVSSSCPTHTKIVSLSTRYKCHLDHTLHQISVQSMLAMSLLKY